jgi:SAM-dependent methyltransferase
MRAEPMNGQQHTLVAHYEACFVRHGDSHLGVDWPNAADAAARYGVMLDVVRQPAENSVLLDFGCGLGHLYQYITENKLTGINYIGLDMSAKFIDACRVKFPSVPFYCLDALSFPDRLPACDYAVLNGVLTEKRELTFDAMWEYGQRLLHVVFARARRGMAFNMMSKHVDWERDDLFHMPFDLLAAYLKQHISRHFTFRADYGLYEFTTYVYRQGGTAWPTSSSLA